MKAFSAAGLQAAGVIGRPLKTGRRALLRTSCLSGAAAALLVFSPQLARAADECGAPVDGVVTCQPGAHFPTGISYSIDPATPQDLTINLGDNQHINTFGPNMGVVAGNLNGSVTVNGHTASIVTAGDGASGIFASTYIGDITIDIGSVEVEGPRGGGIDVSTSGGDINVKAGTVRAFTDGGSGVNILSKAGDVNLDVGLVETNGYGGSGVHVEASGGAANITLGTVYTHGLIDAAGVYATAAGDLTINAGSVITAGVNSSAITAASYGGDLSVTAGTISTSGDNSGGVFALASGDTPGQHLTIDVGSVETHGAGHLSSGIVALNYSDGGAVDVTVHDHVSTRMEGATGVLAFSPTGAVTVDVKDVTTRGGRAEAVRAVGASTTVDVSGTVSTFGDGSTGVYALAWNGAATVNAATVTTSGDGAAGISAIGVAGDVHVTAGAVTTSGAGSTGIQAMAFYPADIEVDVQSVVASGSGAAGVLAHSYYGGAVVHAGTVTAGGMGIGASGKTGSTVTADSVVTHGDAGDGVAAGGGGSTSITVGSVQTSGTFARGVWGFSTGGDVDVTVGSITTAGKSAWGVYTSEHYGDTTIHVGSIATSGEYAMGVLSNLQSGRVSIEVGSLTTSGDRSAGIRVFGSGYAGREIHVTAGSVTTTGAKADGVHLENPDGGIISAVPSGPVLPITLPGGVGGLTGQVKAGGGDAGGPGILAGGPGIEDAATNDITVTTGTVKVSGAGSNGIWAQGVGAVTVDAGATSAVSGKAIDVTARELGSVTVHGATTSQQGDAIALTGADALLTIAAGAKVSGVNGAVVNAVGPYVPPEDGGGGIGPFAAAAGEIGTATVVNAGTLAGTDYALQVNAGRAVVDNRGLIDGAVRLTANDDVLTNAGRFNLAKDSDFGDGADLFVNTGLLAVRPEATGPGAVTLLGLETFRNQGGLVDLRNGHAGDVLTLAGDYVGSGDATLGLDVGGAAVDKLVIAGAATGSTRIVLHATGAPLTGAQPITLVQAGAGSAADAFTLANPEIGFVRYALSLDPGAAAAAVGAAAPTTFVLMSSAGGSAYRALKLQENARDVWTASADAWSAHMAELRDQSWAGGGASPTRRLWGQAFGSTLSRDQRGAQGDDLGWRRDDYGLQFGAELATREQAGGRLQLGATGGWVNSTVNFSGAADRASFDTFNLGGYAGWLKGPLYVNVLAKADYERLKARSAAAGYDESLNGWSYGARLEAGSRFGSAARFVAPEASLAWTRTDLDALKAAGQTVAFDAETALRAKLGARVGGSRRLADGGQAVFYAGAALVHDFGAASALTLQSGGTSQALHDTRPPTRGQGVVGVNATTARGLSGFVEADADFGGGFSGGGARLGVRLKF